MLILASASPRRKELLALITKDFRVVPSTAPEDVHGLNAHDLVLELARRKATEVAARYPRDTVIGADTVVEIDGQILGKPRDRADAVRMMTLLSGKEHRVYTGVCVVRAARQWCDVCVTKVFFTAIEQEEILFYAEHENVLDKAGAYAIQGGAAKFIYKIEGCFYNVMGLPVSRLYAMLNESDAHTEMNFEKGLWILR